MPSSNSNNDRAMADRNEHYDTEVLGTCMTNPTAGSQYTQTVEAKYLWSYAQEEALIGLSERGADGCYRLITDPERRAKRIAARYADLYFESAEKSRGEVQFYWPALAAFVVKDIVEAFRYSRESVLNGGWRNMARTSAMSELVSQAVADGSPYEHAIRVYAALAKGNLWLFMDIYPWLWFFLEYGINKDGTLNASRLTSHVGQRDAATLQQQSRKAVQELPFGANWLGRLKTQQAGDTVYAEASKFFDTRPVWGGMDSGYGQHAASAGQAHRYAKQHVKDSDAGYRLPPSRYWPAFNEAYYVMEEERRELGRIAGDGAGLGKLQKVAKFGVTPEVRNTYSLLIAEFTARGDKAKFDKQKDELAEIAKQEQLNILQPLIYEDAKLIKTMDVNHAVSRYSGGFLSPRYAVVYSAAPKTDDPKLQTVFDEPKGPWDYATGPKHSLPNPVDRMGYVAKIAEDFNRLMDAKRQYMEAELRKIRGWLNA
jgi:hypothetical protein